MAVRLYEAMFVVDASKGGSEFATTVRHIAEILTRNGAEIERIEKWDERKLAYPIQHVKRGIYILVYFRVDGEAIAEIKHMVVLSEELLRVGIFREDAPVPVSGELYSAEGERVEAPAPEAPAPEAAAPAADAPAAEAPAGTDAPEEAKAPEAAAEAEAKPEEAPAE